jgi:hypothetical protein
MPAGWAALPALPPTQAHHLLLSSTCHQHPSPLQLHQPNAAGSASSSNTSDTISTGRGWCPAPHHTHQGTTHTQKGLFPRTGALPTHHRQGTRMLPGPPPATGTTPSGSSTRADILQQQQRPSHTGGSRPAGYRRLSQAPRGSGEKQSAGSQQLMPGPPASRSPPTAVRPWRRPPPPR